MIKLPIWLQSIVLLGVIVLGAGCENKDDGTPDSAAIANEVSSIVNSSIWTITKFIENEVDVTQNYSGMEFEFNSSGTLTATKNTDGFSGTWSVTYDSGSDDSSDDHPHSDYDDIDFNIHFLTPDILIELSEDWEIIAYSAIKIELVHESGGDGDISYLTFEKKQ